MRLFIPRASRVWRRIVLITVSLTVLAASSSLFWSSAQKREILPWEAPSSGTISGRIFQDFNGDGIYDTSGGTSASPLAVDKGVGGATVSAYDSTGVLRGTATAAADGTYSINATGTGPYRVEFTNLPAGYFPSARSTDSATSRSATTAGSTIQFVPNGNTSNVNLALVLPRDYCQNNPQICSQVYGVGAGDQVDAVFAVPFNAGSTRTSGGLPVADFTTPGNTSFASTDQVGATFGLAYNRYSGMLYAASFMKRHTKFGPGGTGAVYQIDPGTGAVSEYVNVNTVFGANTAGANPHNTSDYNTDNGNVAWDAVGKAAFGGMAISDDMADLFVMNLNDRQLYRIPTSGALNSSTIQRVAFPTSMPNCATASEVRPFAVTWYQGTIYVGAVCSRETSGTAQSTSLRAYVYKFDPVAMTFNTTPVMNFQLNYSRLETDPGISADWLNWRTTFSRLDANHFIYPQPMLTDIDFDSGGNMVLSLRDRNGDQVGYNSPSNPGNTNEFQKGITAGDTLRACGNPTAGWTLESNGRCGGLGNAPQGTGEGPGNGEYYYQDSYHPNGTPHDEVSEGGAHQIPGYNVLIATMFDPIYLPNDNIYDSGGFRWLVNSTGAQNRGYMAYNASDFGKANGIGNVIALCSKAPIEIGNRIWRDTNANGVQDPGEPGISGVTVNLYNGSTAVGTAITDTNGEYYFVSSTSADPNTGDNIGQINGGIAPNTAYQIRLDRIVDYNFGGSLYSLNLTTRDQTSQLGDDDATDSDPVWADNPAGSPAGSFPVISVTTGSAGENNHTYDFGLVLAPTAAGVKVRGQVRSAPGNGIRNVLVNLVEANGSVHTTQTGTFGYYNFNDIEAGQSVILTVMAKRYTFRNPSRVILVNDEVANADFVADDPSAVSPQFWISPPVEVLSTGKQKKESLEP